MGSSSSQPIAVGGSQGSQSEVLGSGANQKGLGKRETDFLSMQFSNVLDSHYMSRKLLQPSIRGGRTSAGIDVQVDDGVAEDLRNAAILLVHDALQDEKAQDAENYVRAMSYDLMKICTQQDAFESNVVKRLGLIKTIHEAMTRRECYTGARLKEKWKKLALEHSGDAASSRPKQKPKSSKTISYETQLGIHLFFSMLSFLNADSSDSEQRMTFLENVIPVLAKLPALCLEELSNFSRSAYLTVPRGAPTASYPLLKKKPRLGGSLEILDSLRNFLYHMATSPPRETTSSASSSILELFKGQNQRAVTALALLASIRGHASDILLVISVLLGVDVKFQNCFNDVVASDDEGSLEQHQHHHHHHHHHQQQQQQHHHHHQYQHHQHCNHQNYQLDEHFGEQHPHISTPTRSRAAAANHQMERFEEGKCSSSVRGGRKSFQCDASQATAIPAFN